MIILKIIGIILGVGFLILFFWSIFKVASEGEKEAEKAHKRFLEEEKERKIKKARIERLSDEIAYLYYKRGKFSEAIESLRLGSQPAKDSLILKLAERNDPFFNYAIATLDISETLKPKLKEPLLKYGRIAMLKKLKIELTQEEKLKAKEYWLRKGDYPGLINQVGTESITIGDLEIIKKKLEGEIAQLSKKRV